MLCSLYDLCVIYHVVLMFCLLIMIDLYLTLTPTLDLVISSMVLPLISDQRNLYSKQVHWSVR